MICEGQNTQNGNFSSGVFCIWVSILYLHLWQPWSVMIIIHWIATNLPGKPLSLSVSSAINYWPQLPAMHMPHIGNMPPSGSKNKVRQPRAEPLLSPVRWGLPLSTLRTWEINCQTNINMTNWLIHVIIPLMVLECVSEKRKRIMRPRRI